MATTINDLDRDAQGDLLQNALQRLESGRATFESVVAGADDDTRGMLYTVKAASELPLPLMPSADKAKLRQQTLDAFRAQAAKQKAVPVAAPRSRVSSKPFSSRIAWRASLRLAAVLVVVLSLAFGGTGLVRASEAQVPGEALYGVKRMVEDIRLFFADAEARIGLLYELAQVRLEELETLAQRNLPISDDVLRDAFSTVDEALILQTDPQKRNILITQSNQTLAFAASTGVIDGGDVEMVLNEYGSGSEWNVSTGNNGNNGNSGGNSAANPPTKEPRADDEPDRTPRPTRVTPEPDNGSEGGSNGNSNGNSASGGSNGGNSDNPSKGPGATPNPNPNNSGSGNGNGGNGNGGNNGNSNGNSNGAGGNNGNNQQPGEKGGSNGNSSSGGGNSSTTSGGGNSNGNPPPNNPPDNGNNSGGNNNPPADPGNGNGNGNNNPPADPGGGGGNNNPPADPGNGNGNGNNNPPADPGNGNGNSNGGGKP
jgi:hypothetical protein